MNLTNFDISKSVFNIKLAVVYEPNILNNSISKRPYNAFLYVLNGTYTYKFKQDTKEEYVLVPKDNLLYLPANSVPYSYTVEWADGRPAKTIQIEFELLNSESGEPISFSKTPTVFSSHTNAIKNSMLAIEELLPSTYKSNRITAYSELLKILSLVCEDDAPEKDAAYILIRPAIKHIEKNFNSKITSEELAAICSISESQLRRCFKSTIGTSPKTYQNNLLLKSAKSLLSIGEFSIGQISEMLGFYDIYAFSHFFSKKVGCSPRDFMKK